MRQPMRVISAGGSILVIPILTTEPATKQKPPHVGEVPLTREFETTITAIETKNDRSLEF
jgi:hypothetical protein